MGNFEGVRASDNPEWKTDNEPTHLPLLDMFSDVGQSANGILKRIRNVYQEQIHMQAVNGATKTPDKCRCLGHTEQMRYVLHTIERPRNV